MSKRQHKPRKRFGQNFLQDHVVISNIIAALAPKPKDNIVEIGPGLGVLTREVIDLVDFLHVIEIDRDLITLLEEQFQDNPKIKIHQADALRYDFSKLAKPDQPLKLFGNLPYNIATQLIFHLLDNVSIIYDMHFMTQKEVADRMAAKPRTSAYGRLSIMLQYYCHVEVLFDVDKTAFHPEPKVTSSVVRLIPHKIKPHVAKDIFIFGEIVREAFNQRRKTIRNSLNNFIEAETLEDINIDPKHRAEELTIKDFVKISNYLSE